MLKIINQASLYFVYGIIRKIISVVISVQNPSYKIYIN
jgi:hypothetical protein